MQDLEAHALALAAPVLAAAGHVGVAVDHTGGAHPAALADLAVVGVVDVLHGVAGAGGTCEVAAAAADAAGAVLVPDGILVDTVGNLVGNRDTGRVLRHVLRFDILLRPAVVRKERVQGSVEDLAGEAVVSPVEGEKEALCRAVGAHVDAEAVRAGPGTSEQDKVDAVPDLFIKRIRELVVQIDLVQALHSVHVTALEEDDDFARIPVRSLDLVFREEKERLGERCQDLLECVVRLLIQLDLIDRADEVVAHDIRVGKSPFADLAHGGVEPVLLTKLRQDPVKALF